MYTKARNLSKALMIRSETSPLCSQKPIFGKLTWTALCHVFLVGPRRDPLNWDPQGFVVLKMLIDVWLTACKHRQPPRLLTLGFKLSPAPLASFKSCQQHAEESLWDTAKIQAAHWEHYQVGTRLSFQYRMFSSIKREKGEKKWSGIWINLLDFDL